MEKHRLYADEHLFSRNHYQIFGRQITIDTGVYKILAIVDTERSFPNMLWITASQDFLRKDLLELIRLSAVSEGFPTAEFHGPYFAEEQCKSVKGDLDRWPFPNLLEFIISFIENLLQHIFWGQRVLETCGLPVSIYLHFVVSAGIRAEISWFHQYGTIHHEIRGEQTSLENGIHVVNNRAECSSGERILTVDRATERSLSGCVSASVGADGDGIE